MKRNYLITIAFIIFINTIQAQINYTGTTITDTSASAIGTQTNSGGRSAFAFGKLTKAIGNYTFAGGVESEAIGNFSFCFGDLAKTKNSYTLH